VIRFTVNGNPVPKKRPRKGRGGHFYTPGATREWEEAVGWAYKEAGGQMLEGDIAVSCWFFRGDRRRADIDNLLKSVLDGLNGVAFEDDDRVVHMSAWKDYDAENPRAEVELEVME
jgi:crossover junction endodeoxyribonuclease RusA